MALSEVLVSVCYNERDKYNQISREAMDHRLSVCNECEYCHCRNCDRIGCSAWRFKEVLLSKHPKCPEGKHKQ